MGIKKWKNFHLQALFLEHTLFSDKCSKTYLIGLVSFGINCFWGRGSIFQIYLSENLSKIGLLEKLTVSWCYKLRIKIFSNFS